jgi:hypothetical protein
MNRTVVFQRNAWYEVVKMAPVLYPEHLGTTVSIVVGDNVLIAQCSDGYGIEARKQGLDLKDEGIVNARTLVLAQ